MPSGRKTRQKLSTYDPVQSYSQDVLAGRVIAGPYVRLACQRHLEDLERAHLRGFHWDLDAAQEIFDLAKLVSTPEGDPFELIDWQYFVFGSIYGWRDAEDYRRFVTAYIETAKGQGKSPMCGIIALDGLLIDIEPLPEIYAAATKRDQAKIVWMDACNIYENSPALTGPDPSNGPLRKYVNVLSNPETGGFFKPISADAKKSSGPRPYIVIADEVHEHPNGELLRILRAGFKKRRAPLMVEITNSGKDVQSVCYQHHEYSIKVLEKTLEDDTWFGYVCALDEGDNWKEDRTCWMKANPSLGKIITEKYLEQQVKEAVGMPANEPTVARLNFCIWSEAEVKSIDMVRWNKGGPDPSLPLNQVQDLYQTLIAKLAGRDCFGGLDLAKVDDMSAYTLFFPKLGKEPAYLLAWFWCPEVDIAERSQKHHVDSFYEVWRQFGFLTSTPGNTTDFTFIKRDLLQINKKFNIIKSGFDRHFSHELVQGLISEGMDMVEFGQGFQSMASPTAELLRLIKAEELYHGGHPVLRWNASNLVCEENPAGDKKPDKSKSTAKIDGISASCNSIGMYQEEPQQKKVSGGYEAW